MNCPICGADPVPAGRKFGAFSDQWYELRHCVNCRFSFVANPCTDFKRIYSSDYYNGTGADPFVDYMFEMEHPEKTIRRYEWEGILKLISHIMPVNKSTRWLDFGCGNGGLVKYVRRATACEIFGLDEGWIVDQCVKNEVPMVRKEQIKDLKGTFNMVTAIEVLEHVIDPLETLRLVATLLKPGGLFFLTTGNAKPFRNRLKHWRYVIPEIHVSFFEPETLSFAMQKVGLIPAFRGWMPGFDSIIRFKILKTLGIKNRSVFERLLPWNAISPLVDSYYGVSHHPLAGAGKPDAGSGS